MPLALDQPLTADLAQATGIARKAIAEQFNRAAIVDAVVGIMAAGYLRPGVAGERVADAAGLSKSELGTGIVRYHDHHRREMKATAQAYQQPRPHKRHAPIGEPPSPEHRWCKRGRMGADGHVGHWALYSEMGRKADRPEGIGDWCKPCWREYWRTNVAKGQEPVPEPVVASAAVRAPLRPKRQRKATKRRRTSVGPTCVECRALMVEADGKVRCVNERCTIGVVNRNRLRRAYLRARQNGSATA